MCHPNFESGLFFLFHPSCSDFALSILHERFNADQGGATQMARHYRMRGSPLAKIL